MSVSKFPISGTGNEHAIAAAAAGSFSLGRVAAPGLYLIETDTTQSIDASAFYVESLEGFQYTTASVIRGGLSYVSLATSSDTIGLTSASFPVAINLRATDYALAPQVDASITDLNAASLQFLVPLPAGSDSFIVYWPNGDNASVSGSAASVTVPGAILPSSGSMNFTVGVSVYDAAGVPGRAEVTDFVSASTYTSPPTDVTGIFYTAGSVALTASLTGGATGFSVRFPDFSSASFSGSTASVGIPAAYQTLGASLIVDAAQIVSGALGYYGAFNLGVYPWIEFLSTGTFDPPPGTASVDVYLVAGGGGTQQQSWGSSPFISVGGGGAAGVYTASLGVAVPSPRTVTIGGGGAIDGNGSPTSFGPIGVTGGNVGPHTANTANTGASNPVRTGGSGSSTLPARAAGGGGGNTANGSNGSTGPNTAAIGGSGGAGVSGGFSVPVGGGGGGAIYATGPVASGGSGPDGGGAGRTQTTNPGLQSGTPGSANRGGGGGGGTLVLIGGYGSGTGGGSTGGSGRVAIRVIY